VSKSIALFVSGVLFGALLSWTPNQLSAQGSQSSLKIGPESVDVLETANVCVYLPHGGPHALAVIPRPPGGCR